MHCLAVGAYCQNCLTEADEYISSECLNGQVTDENDLCGVCCPGYERYADACASEIPGLQQAADAVKQGCEQNGYTCGAYFNVISTLVVMLLAKFAYVLM